MSINTEKTFRRTPTDPEGLAVGGETKRRTGQFFWQDPPKRRRSYQVSGPGYVVRLKPKTFLYPI